MGGKDYYVVIGQKKFWALGGNQTCNFMYGLEPRMKPTDLLASKLDQKLNIKKKRYIKNFE